ncbi:transposable element Tcb2 transposase [Trichonephila clavipes]|uniref:Transposable element Tcb2 transposase n=1 Tax=Trichonephila clavipes TaxID=2585209 RepID=A0A8X6VQ94_TRICX|nr:transposable element Tcb2 transposase [Trichonephila clavipes]
MSVRDDRHLLCMAVNDRAASYRQLATSWSTATGIPGAIFQQNNAHQHAEKTVLDFCSAEQMQLLPWRAYLLDMSPIERVWGLVGWRLALDLSPAAL